MKDLLDAVQKYSHLLVEKYKTYKLFPKSLKQPCLLSSLLALWLLAVFPAFYSPSVFQQLYLELEPILEHVAAKELTSSGGASPLPGWAPGAVLLPCVRIHAVQAL